MGWGANPDRRLLECSGSRTTHQFPGNVSSILCNQSLHQGSSGNLSFTAYRQHVCGDLCQSNGGDNVSVTYCPGNRSLVLVPTEKNHSCSTVHSRARKYHSRLSVKASKRQDGLGVRTHHFQLCEHSVGPASGGSFCNTFFKATSPFLQLATGPQSRGHRCFCTELDQYPRLCTSSLVPNFTSPIRKVQADQATVVLITPLWHTQSWFPVLMNLLVDYPLLLPKMEGVMRPSPNCDCPIQGLPPQLVAWRVSGRDSEQKRFQTRLSNSSCPPGETKPIQTTTQCGKLGSPGVQQQVFIPFCQVYPMF